MVTGEGEVLPVTATRGAGGGVVEAIVDVFCKRRVMRSAATGNSAAGLPGMRPADAI
jgi:hypothetical protein